MTKTIIDGVETTVYREEEYKEAQASFSVASGKILIARPCVRCGDVLLASPAGLSFQPLCAQGQHNSRPGVWY